MRQRTDLLTIGETAERSGVAPSALRYYETQGLISSVRTTGNQRRYQRSTLRRIAFIRSAQRVGLSLEEISEALSTLPGGRTPTTADWTQLSATWRGRINEQIERLERLRDRLDSCIGCGCLSLNRCSLSNPDDHLRSRGPGAVYLEPGGTSPLEPPAPRREHTGARPQPSAG
jgi:MerR family transcriptional regulator, redox-sensitive transcriptional activator SoxR